jgi:hypothetical protein
LFFIIAQCPVVWIESESLSACASLSVIPYLLNDESDKVITNNERLQDHDENNSVKAMAIRNLERGGMYSEIMPQANRNRL